MKINVSYITRFQEVANLFLKQPVPDHLIVQWYNGYWETATYTLQDFFCNYSKVSWSTGIGAIEAVELIISEAVGNANLKADWSVA